MSIVFKGKKIEVPGIVSVSWLDGNPKIKRCSSSDLRKRERRVRGIVAHTHEGVRGTLLPGVGPNTTIDERLAMYQVNTDRYVSWDWTHDLNGDVTWQNDPDEFYTFQAGTVNDVTVGFEMIQQLRRNTEGKVVSGDLYEGQLEKVVLMVDFITAVLGVQRQIPWDKVNNRPARGVIPRMASGEFVGVYGHRNVTDNKGVGDPGDAVFYALRDAGYERFDVNSSEDLNTWKMRQIALGMDDDECDGVPLDKTMDRMKQRGFKHGLWVSRPVDNNISL